MEHADIEQQIRNLEYKINTLAIEVHKLRTAGTAAHDGDKRINPTTNRIEDFLEDYWTPELTPTEDKIYCEAVHKPQSIDQIAERLGMSSQEVAKIALKLEKDVKEGGGYYLPYCGFFWISHSDENGIKYFACQAAIKKKFGVE